MVLVVLLAGLAAALVARLAVQSAVFASDHLGYASSAQVARSIRRHGFQADWVQLQPAKVLIGAAARA